MLLAILITVLCVVVAVTLHMLVLHLLWYQAMPRLTVLPRGGIVPLVLGALVGHLLEIMIFALGFSLFTEESLLRGDWTKPGPFYYSAAAFTSLGTEPLPSFELRLLTVVEALTGLVLITWTASFLFIVMQRYWKEE